MVNKIFDNKWVNVLECVFNFYYICIFCVNILECVFNFLVRFFIKFVDIQCIYLYDEQVLLDFLNVIDGEWKVVSWNFIVRMIRFINTFVNNSYSVLFKQDK